VLSVEHRAAGPPAPVTLTLFGTEHDLHLAVVAGEAPSVAATASTPANLDTANLAGLVLVDAMDAHEEVQHQQARRQAPHGVGQAVLVAGSIEAHAGGGDDEHGSAARESPRLRHRPASRALTSPAASSAM
jgi:hypothetical protein